MYGPGTRCRQRCLRDGDSRGYRRPVTKQQLIVALAQRLEVPKVRASEIVDALFASDGLIASELRKSGRVQITGFGNFEVRRRAGRAMRNPRTGKTITLPASSHAGLQGGQATQGRGRPAPVLGRRSAARRPARGRAGP